MFDSKLLKLMMDRYGHIEDLNQLHDVLRKDGLGPLVDLLNDNGEFLDSFVQEHQEEIDEALKHYTELGIMPVEEPVSGQPVGENDSFKFDPQACLSNCDGKCCHGRNYLMITYYDIIQLLTSPAAHHLAIYSTRDLIEQRPPVIEVFFNQEYEVNLPYLRFLPLGADLDTRPEQAENSICPFLYPMADVYTFHNMQLPDGTSRNAMGCILMDCKPLICRLSPIGQVRGMITGRLSYEYIEPTKDCPGCAADVEIPFSNYIKALITSPEDEARALFHRMLMAHDQRRQEGQDLEHFNSILLGFYNIDNLLSMYGHARDRRPNYLRLMEILVAAAKGDFTEYDRFIQSL